MSIIIHLSTPNAPKAPACGAVGAKHFTYWRWRATCTLCKVASAAVGYEATRSAVVAYRADIPCRYSALVAFVWANGGTEKAIAEFERDRQIAGSVCPSCKAALPDPIALMDMQANRMVFACPACSEPKLRERWARKGLE
jgi:hypothetical protein